MAEINRKKITDYKPLNKNPNKGTNRGGAVLEQSVRDLGAGRSILVDKNGEIIAGNHAQQAFIDAGIEDVIEVETTGHEVVVVRRNDLEAGSPDGKKMAILDNRSSELGLEWDNIVLEELMDDIQAQEGEIDLYLKDLAEDVGIEAPDFEPVGIDEQGRLDEKKKVVCPDCGCEFEL